MTHCARKSLRTCDFDLDSAQKAIMAAVTEAKKRNWKMAIAVVGPARQLVAHARA